MARINKDDVRALIKEIGGRGNVAGVSHCMTRMRFVLNDESKANIEKIESIKSVKGTFTNAGQFQVIIGPQVKDFYNEFISESNVEAMSKDAAKKAARENMSFVERAISHLAEIFVPLLPALITGGLILGFRNVIGDIKMFDGKTLVEISSFWAGIHSFLWLIGEAIFHFLPVGVTWSVVKKMGGTPILGIILGITLVSPQLMNAYGIGQQAPELWDFGGFTIEKIGYQAQVIPAMFAGMILAWIENNMKKITPSSVEMVVVPFVTILLSVTLAHTLIGPAGRWVGDLIATVTKFAITGKFAIFGAAIFGFFYAPLVITGVHHTTNAVDLQLMQDLGGTPIWPMIALSNIAQASAVVGIILVSKKKNEREISVPAAISAYLGVTEPAMYGINLKYKFPMVCAMISSGIAAVLITAFGTMANSIGVGGLPGILSIKSNFWPVYSIAMVICIIMPIILTMAVYKKKFDKEVKETEAKKEELKLASV